MRITCPSCTTSYTIPDEKIGAKGRQVKCASCGTKWQVSLADALAAGPPVDVDDFFDKDAERLMPSFDPPVRTPNSQAVADVHDPGFAEEMDAGSADDMTTSAADGREGISAGSEPSDDRGIQPSKKIDIETLAKKPKITAKKGKPPKAKSRVKFDFERFLVRARPVFGAATLVLSIGVVAGALVLRGAITAAFPSLAALYAMIGLPVNLRGLEIDHLQLMREVENAQPVLVVEGELSNSTTSEHGVPAIRFALRGDDSQEIYAWSIEPKQTVITPGATMRFRTRLASPPEQAADIQVRMIDRRIQQAALHE